MASLFSVSTYETILDQCLNLVDGTAVAINDFIHVVDDMVGWIPFIGGVITDLLNELASLVQDLLNLVMKLLEQAQAPVLFWEFAQAWGSGGVAGQAGEIASTLAGQKQFSSEWQGLAGAAFATSVSGQEPAVDTVQARANMISGACHSIAQYGFTFYTAMAGLLTALIAYAAIAGPAPEAFIAETIKIGLAMAAAVAALEFGVSTQTGLLHQAAEPNDTMPGGNWPQAVADIRAVPKPKIEKIDTYTVKPGDNLWDISGRKYGDPDLWPVIEAANSRKIPDPNLIFPGQVLQIPSIPKVPADSTTYTVRPGDTVSAIANGNPALVRRIAEINHLPDHASLIFPGQVLIIPPAS